MAVTIKRYLNTGKVDKSGRMPVRLSVSYNGRRVFINTGQVVEPGEWLDTKKQVRGAAPNAAARNREIQKAEEACGKVYYEALARGEVLDPEVFRARVKEELIPVEVKAARKPDPVSLVALADEYLAGMLREGSHVTGRPHKEGTIANRRSTRNAVADYDRWRGRESRPRDLDMGWYGGFREYVTGPRKCDLQTFYRFIRELKTMWRWHEKRGLELGKLWRDFPAPARYVGADALTPDEVQLLQHLDFSDHLTRSRVAAQLAPDAPAQRERGGTTLAFRVGQRCQLLERLRDRLLMMCYTGLRRSDLLRLEDKHIHDDLIVISPRKVEGYTSGQYQIECYIPFHNDELVRPVTLTEKARAERADRVVAGKKPGTLFKFAHNINDFLPFVGELAGVTRIHLTTKVGRKTFVTLMLNRGIPSRLVMRATGHQTEKAFNRYVGFEAREFLRIWRLGQLPTVAAAWSAAAAVEPEAAGWMAE
jgi:integrase